MTKINARKNLFTVSAKWDKSADKPVLEAKYVDGFNPELIIVKDNEVNRFSAMVEQYIAYAHIVEANKQVESTKKKLEAAQNDVKAKREDSEKSYLSDLEKAEKIVKLNEAIEAETKAYQNHEVAKAILEKWKEKDSDIPEIAVIPAVIMACLTDSIALKYYEKDTTEDRRKNMIKAPYNVFNVFNDILVVIKQFWAENDALFENPNKLNKAYLQELSRKIHARFGNSIEENDMFNTWSYGNLKRGDLSKLLLACHGQYERKSGLVVWGTPEDAEARFQIALHMVDLWERKPVSTIGADHAVDPKTTFKAKAEKQEDKKQSDKQ